MQNKRSNELMLSQLLRDYVDISAAQDRAVSGIRLNSSQCGAGDVFIALRGHQTHGIHYADQALRAGATAVLYETAQDLEQETLIFRRLEKSGVPIIAVDNLKHCVGAIAERFFGQPSAAMSMVGITGTNGKTSCAQFLAQMLSEDRLCAVLGTIGNGIYGQLQQSTHTTPDAISLHALLAGFHERGATATVMEVSSHGLHQGRVAGVAFDVGVFTNISRDHLDYHGDMDQYAEAKRLLFLLPSLKHAVINADDAVGMRFLTELPAGLNKIAYTLADENQLQNTLPDSVALIRASQIRQSPQGLQFQLSTPWGSSVVHSSLLGRFNVGNMLAVFGVLMVMGVAFDVAVKRLHTLRTISGRMQRLGGVDGAPLVVVDYAHTPDALENVLKSLRDHLGVIDGVEARKETVKDCARGKLVCVFGCGGDRDKGKRPQMGAVAQRYADRVVITDDNPRSEASIDIIADIQKGLDGDPTVQVIADRVTAIAGAIIEAGADDVVLIAGKGHEDYQIVGDTKIPYIGDVAQAQSALKQRRGGEVL